MAIHAGPPIDGVNKTFTIDVAETIVVRKRYTVAADTMDEARAKALTGETIAEFDLGDDGVISREII